MKFIIWDNLDEPDRFAVFVFRSIRKCRLTNGSANMVVLDSDFIESRKGNRYSHELNHDKFYKANS